MYSCEFICMRLTLMHIYNLVPHINKSNTVVSCNADVRTKSSFVETLSQKKPVGNGHTWFKHFLIPVHRGAINYKVCSIQSIKQHCFTSVKGAKS